MLTWSHKKAWIAAATVTAVAVIFSFAPDHLAYAVPQWMQLIMLGMFTVASAVRAIRTRSRVWSFITLFGALVSIGQAGFIRAGVLGGPDHAGTPADLIYMVGFLVGAFSVGWLVYGNLHGARLLAQPLRRGPRRIGLHLHHLDGDLRDAVQRAQRYGPHRPVPTPHVRRPGPDGRLRS